MIKYTEEQQKAVFNLEDNIILGAGAGSGKTRVLVGRYLQLLESRRAGISEILAITFTKKAAGEMLERIREELQKRSQQGDLAEREYWYNNLLKLNQARISTFHSLASGLLRENPVDAGLDPDFRVLDEEETARLLSEVIEETIEEGLARSEENLLKLAREFDLYTLPTLLEQLYRVLRQTRLSVRDIIEKTAEHHHHLWQEFEEFKREFIENTEELLADYGQLDITTLSRQKLDQLSSSWPDIREALSQIRRIDEREKMRVIEGMSGILKGRFSKELKEQINQLKEMVNERLPSYLVLEIEEALLEPVGRVTAVIEEKYSSCKGEMSALDFSDLELRLLNLLEQNPELLRQLQQSFRYIMVDEFQDNSPRQEKLITLLSRGEGVNLFLVGDPKQSIYRFRGADVRVFKRQRERILNENGRELNLSRNFRSREPILDFSNFLFSRLMDSSLDPGLVDYSPLDFERSGGKQGIEVLLLDREGLDDDKQYRKEEAALIASRVAEMISDEALLLEEDGEKRPLQYGDFAILFQSLSSIVCYEQALQARGIPSVVVNGRGFYEQQEILDIINLLRVIDSQQQLIPLAGLLRSPFCGCSDEELYCLCRGGKLQDNIELNDQITGISGDSSRGIVKLRKLIEKGRRLKDRLPLRELLESLIQESGYLAGLAAGPYFRQQLANINKFLGIIEEYEQVENPSLRELLDYLDDKRQRHDREGMAAIEQEGRNRVELMSIHQAKGLEFPVVFLADCQRSFFNHNYVMPVLLDEKKGLALKVKYNYGGRSYQRSPLYQELFEREKAEEIAESQRLFYVAVTRARDYLLLSGSVKKKLECSNFASARSWLDWLAWSSGVDLLELAREGEKLSFDYNGKEGEIVLKSCGGQEDSSPDIKENERIDSAGLTENIITDNILRGEGIPGDFEWEQSAHWYRLAAKAAPLPRYRSQQKPVFSVTGLMVYNDCPRRYYLKYIRGLPGADIFHSAVSSGKGAEAGQKKRKKGERELEKIEEKVDSNISRLTAAEKGSLIHRLWELSNQERSPEAAYLQALSELEIKIEPAVETRREIFQLFDKYRQCLKKRRADSPAVVQEEWEQEFLLSFSSFYLAGQIDYLLKYEDGSGEINDLKSNNISTEEVKEAGEYYRLQLEAYSLAVFWLKGISPLRARLDFLIPSKEWELDFTTEDFPRLEEKISRRGEELLKLYREEDFPEKQGKGCRYCNYRHLCSKKFSSL